MDEYYDPRCPACGALIDFCQGHGEIGDPAGYAVLQKHDDDSHEDCNSHGCDVAREAVWDDYIPGTVESD